MRLSTQRDNPELRGKPVIVAWQARRSVVCAASYEARSFGVHSAMPAVRAERLCPHAIFVAPDFTRYRAVSQSVRVIFKRHTDLIEPLSLDKAYLNVTESKTGLPTATLVARTIREQIRHELHLTSLHHAPPTAQPDPSRRPHRAVGILREYRVVRRKCARPAPCSARSGRSLQPSTFLLVVTSLQQRLVKTGGRLVKHARYYWLLLAESHLTRRLFGSMVRRIAVLSLPAG
jgi:hypothetical protein